MNIYDLGMIVYLLLIIIGLPISYKYASSMMKRTGFFFFHLIVACGMLLSLGILATISWLVFTFDGNEFLFFGGATIGVITTVSCVFMLGSVLIIRKNTVLNLEREGASTERSGANTPDSKII
ncbi:hypothetical protein [Bacillus sp. 2205SS5-2]|uniref:hypothetical protein n=1 Tax=Bacillus sp. 2205SS5-2 TaxID=3109031 RepID=UPI003003BF95